MNNIIIFKNDASRTLLERVINELPPVDEGQLIVKIIDGDDLGFESYRHTFSPRSIDLAQGLSLNKEVWFNFDVDTPEKLEAVKASELSKLFVDFYVEHPHQLECIVGERARIHGRVDLNIINGSVPYREAKDSSLFDNVDRYYSVEKLMLERMREKRLSRYVEACEAGDFKNYVLGSYSPSMIYRHVGQDAQDWQIYLFGISRFFNTGLRVGQVRPSNDLEMVRKWLIQRSNTHQACLFCDFKLGCLSNDTFFYFSEAAHSGDCGLKEVLESAG